jgi:hypothetical protein
LRLTLNLWTPLADIHLSSLDSPSFGSFKAIFSQRQDRVDAFLFPILGVVLRFDKHL